MFQTAHHIYLFGVIMPLFLTACQTTPPQEGQPDAALSYHFLQPARMWEETFPLGNGRIGMMPDGRFDSETIVLNEVSLWSGCKHNADNPKAKQYLDQIASLIFEGRNDEAQQLMYSTFTCGGSALQKGNTYNNEYGSYQLLGNLNIHYTDSDTLVQTYRRELQLDRAISTTQYQVGDTHYTREYFTSFSDDIGVIRLSSDGVSSIQFALSLDRRTSPQDAQTTPITYQKEGNDLVMLGQLIDGTESDSEAPRGMKYGSRVRVLLPAGGELSFNTETNQLQVQANREAIIFVAMATNYFGMEVQPQLTQLLDNASTKDFEHLKQDHIQSFGKFFNRVGIDFGHDTELESLPIDQRLIRFAETKADPSLAELYYQFGRYLLICSARQGLLPPNLQGIWANTIMSPWNSDYHLNINFQMNHWPAETGNLAELHEPLIEWTQSQVESGRHTADVFYGAQGWVTHILGNVWQYTAPGEHPSWGATNTAAAWLCEHLYSHYQYSQDIEYLKKVYPTMKEAALFFVCMMKEDPRSHYLVTVPTTSPENAFYMPNGKRAYVCAGSTMDNQIVRELFTNVIEASQILGQDQTFADTLRQRIVRIRPTTIGDDGRIMEWSEPYAETEITHRHISHLYGLYPSHEIDPQTTPDLAEAARQTLIVRGDASTGWSMGWKINLWARLRDGNHAYKLFTDLLRPCQITTRGYGGEGGSYNNLFCAHPPFQIDGNFGGCAGISEMMLQSRANSLDKHYDIFVLPALPEALSQGSFYGLRAQGNCTLAATWKDMKLEYLNIDCLGTGVYRFHLPPCSDQLRIVCNNHDITSQVSDGILIIENR